jgi:hypothetical protein
MQKRKIKGYEGLYEITSDGRVWSCKNSKYLVPVKMANGYLKVNLYYEGKPKLTSIHRLVAISYLDNPKNKPTVNHIDGNKENNNILNLEWATYSENQKHAFNNGLKKGRKGEKHHLCKLTEQQVSIIKYAVSFGTKQRHLVKIFNIKPAQISRIVNNKRWTHI